jgi:hypothetical protein
MKRVKQVQDEAAHGDACPTDPAGGTPAVPGGTKPATVGEVKKGAQEVAEAAKNAKKAVGELFGKVFDMEQMALFDQPEFEEALLLDGETLRKRYTAAQAEKIEWRMNACLYMLGRECPVEEIAVILHMNLRTVAAIAAQNGRKLGAFTAQFANELVADAASDIALARTKRDTASYKDLHIGAGIKMQHAAALKIVVDSSPDGKPAEDVEADHPGLVALREQMKKLKPAEGPEKP